MSVESHYLLSRSYELTYLIQKRYTKKYIRTYIKNVHTTMEVNGITNWIYSLIKTSQHLNDSKYLYQACQIMLTNYDQIPNELDLFITLNTLILNLTLSSQLNKLSDKSYKIYRDSLMTHLEAITPNIIKYIEKSDISLIATDSLESIGFLLTSCLKIRKLIHRSKSHKFITNFIRLEELYKLYEIVLDNSLTALRACKFTPYRINNNGYKWFDICIGVEAINILFYHYINDFIDRDKYLAKIKILMGFYKLKRIILTNFSTYSLNKGNWDSYKDINSMMLRNTEFPIL
jgi:hypothetical protein